MIFLNFLFVKVIVLLSGFDNDPCDIPIFYFYIWHIVKLKNNIPQITIFNHYIVKRAFFHHK